MEKEHVLAELAGKRIICITDPITTDTSRQILLAMGYLNAKNESEITLEIRCPGGDVIAGLAIYDIIRNSRAPVTGIVIEKAHSIANVLLQGCKKRLAMKHSEFLMHYLTPRELPTLDEINDSPQKAFERANRSQEYIIDIYRKRTKRSHEEVDAALRAKKFFFAEEAREFRLIDDII